MDKPSYTKCHCPILDSAGHSAQDCAQRMAAGAPRGISPSKVAGPESELGLAGRFVSARPRFKSS